MKDMKMETMMNKKISELGFGGLNDEQDLNAKKTLKSSHPENPNSDNKQGWEIKRLGDICDLQNGFAFKSNDYIDFSNTMNFRMSQIRPGGGIDLENNPKYLPDDYAVKYKDYLLKEGDVVIAMTDLATETKILGVPTIVPKDERNWLLNQRVGKLFKIDFSKVSVPYLKYILTSETVNEYYKSLGRGGLQINIGKQDILNAKIPIPPLPEQQRIVAILNEAFAAIAKAKANAEQNLKNAKELFESYLQETFSQNHRLKVLKDSTDLKSKKSVPSEQSDKICDSDNEEVWEEKTLGEVAQHSLGKMLDKNKNKGILQKYLRNQSVRWFEFDLSDLTEMPFLESEKEKFTAIKGDVLICEGGYPGRAAIWQEDYPIYFQKAIHRVRFHKAEYNEWFLYYLFLLDSTDKLKAHFTGTGIQHLTGQALNKLTMPIPPLGKVTTIVQKLDALSIETKKLEAIYLHKLNDLEEQKKSVLQKAFSGALKTASGILS